MTVHDVRSVAPPRRDGAGRWRWAIVVIVVAACALGAARLIAGREDGKVDPASPGTEAALRKQYTEHGPIWVEGDEHTASYWLVVLYDADRHYKEQDGGLVAIAPHRNPFDDESCIVQPVEGPKRAGLLPGADPLSAPLFKDCTDPRGELSAGDMQMYNLRVDQGRVKVDTGNMENVEPPA